MQRCEFCGSELPVDARFCGNCGQLLPDSGLTVTDITDPTATGIPEPHTPSLFSSPSYPNVQDTGMGGQESDATLRTDWSNADMESVNPQFTDRKSDENDAVLPDLLSPGMLAMQGQMPSPAQAPMVQGTPQVGGVPSVQGTPAAPGNVPQSVPGPAHGAGSSAPSYAPQEPQSIPVHPQPVQQPMHQPPPPHYQPVHHPQPTPPPNELEHQHHRHHHTGPLRTHRPHPSRLHHPAAVTSKAGMGVSKWLIVALAAVVVIAASGVMIVLANSPGLSLSGNSTVAAGQVLHLHGKGFLPGGSVVFTLDNSLPISLIHHNPTGEAGYSRNSGASSASVLQMLLAEQVVLQATPNATVSVSALGTFDTTLGVSTSWSPGVHTLHAREALGSRSADLSFRITPPPKLLVQQKNFTAGSSDCLAITGSGNLIRGWVCTVTLNTDSGDLSWSASSTDPSDRFTPSKGVVHPQHPEQVTIFIPNEPRCSKATFMFVGPANTISVSWSCPTR